MPKPDGGVPQHEGTSCVFAMGVFGPARGFSKQIRLQAATSACCECKHGEGMRVLMRIRTGFSGR